MLLSLIDFFIIPSFSKPKKRMLMRSNFGNYRQKMTTELKKQKTGIVYLMILNDDFKLFL